MLQLYHPDNSEVPII
jgi:hypothetical protein